MSDPNVPEDPARRQWLAGAAGMATLAAAPQAIAASTDANGRKVLRLSFQAAETSLDPAKIVDLYSRTVTPHIFEALYNYDYLARPAKIKPCLPRRCRSTRTTSASGPSGSAAASSSPTTRPSRASGARWWRRTSSTPSNASSTPR
jgi:hypothetical protein